MHHNKNIEKVSELKDFFVLEENLSDTFLDILKSFTTKSISEFLGVVKVRGYHAVHILEILVILPFLALSSVRALFYSGYAGLSEAQKDTFYRLKNNAHIDWRKFLYLIVKRFRFMAGKHGEEDQGPQCLIIDDSFLAKTGAKLEGVSKVFDHVSQRYLLGYKLLCLGFWDGKSFLPLDFSLHREKGRSKTKMFGLSRKQREEQYDKQREDGSYGSNRKAELDTPKTEQAIKMIRRAMKNGFRGDYVLADSWFFSYDLMKTIRRLKKGAVHLIAMAKMGRAKYSYDNSDYTAGQLRRHLRGKIKRCRKLGASYITCEAEYKGQPVKLFFVRYAGQKKWQMVVTTDTSLSFIKAMEIYSIRWSIEVFFKEAKQYLYLGKCQSNDFDAQIADTTITMTQYVLLAFCKRMNNYESMGEMFKDQRETISELLLSSRLWGLLVALARQLCEVLGIEPMNVMQQIMERSDDTRIIKILELCQNQNESEVGKKAA